MKVYVKDRFASIPNELLNRRDLSLKAKGLFGYIQSKPDNWTFTIKSMSLQLKEGKESIQSAIKELEDCGYLERKHQKDKSGMFTHYIYVLINNPDKTIGESSKRKNQQLGNPVAIRKKEESKNNTSSKEEDVSAHTGADSAKHIETETHKKHKAHPDQSPTPSADQDCSTSLSERVSSTTQPTPPPDSVFDADEWIAQLVKDEKRHIRVIGIFLQRKREEFGTPDLSNKQEAATVLRRYVRTAVSVGNFTNDKIVDAIDKAFSFTKEESTLETVLKYLTK
jgi:hypothetical protein